MGSFMYGLKKTEVTCICDNVYVITDRAGCCVNLVTGKEKALVFDTGSGTDDIHGLVRGITGLPLVVINSHGHFDHIGGNGRFDTVYMHPDDFVVLESLGSGGGNCSLDRLACASLLKPKRGMGSGII